eukprot:5949194-Pyramimonas_sp.AAC.1
MLNREGGALAKSQRPPCVHLPPIAAKRLQKRYPISSRRAGASPSPSQRRSRLASERRNTTSAAQPACLLPTIW